MGKCNKKSSCNPCQKKKNNFCDWNLSGSGFDSNWGNWGNNFSNNSFCCDKKKKNNCSVGCWSNKSSNNCGWSNKSSNNCGWSNGGCFDNKSSCNDSFGNCFDNKSNFDCSPCKKKKSWCSFDNNNWNNWNNNNKWN